MSGDRKQSVNSLLMDSETESSAPALRPETGAGLRKTEELAVTVFASSFDFFLTTPLQFVYEGSGNITPLARVWSSGTGENRRSRKHAESCIRCTKSDKGEH
jgi:hypothetical protein